MSKSSILLANPSDGKNVGEVFEECKTYKGDQLVKYLDEVCDIGKFKDRQPPMLEMAKFEVDDNPEADD